MSCICESLTLLFFLFHHPPTTDTYPLSLHDALPICFTAIVTETGPDSALLKGVEAAEPHYHTSGVRADFEGGQSKGRSEEHTSELQSRFDLVCRLLLEKKKKKK